MGQVFIDDPKVPSKTKQFRDIGDLRTGWRDLLSAVNAARVTGASEPTFTAFRGGIYQYSFSATVMNQVVMNPFHIDHDYASGTDLFIHVHWSTAGTNTGVVRWGLEWTYAKGHDQEAFPVTQTYYLEQAASGTAYQHMVAEGTIPGTDVIEGTANGIETDGLVLVRLFRDAAHANDTCTDAAFAFTVDIHYQCDHYNTPNKAPDFGTWDPYID